MKARGLSGISKSQVSKLCKEIDERVNAFLNRPLEGDWPNLWLDATYLKVREGGRIVSAAAIIAVATNTEGRREIVGLGIGPLEAETFWAGVLKTLVQREKYHPWSLSVANKRLGFSRQKARPSHPEKDEAAQEAFKGGSPNA